MLLPGWLFPKQARCLSRSTWRAGQPPKKSSAILLDLLTRGLMKRSTLPSESQVRSARVAGTVGSSSSLRREKKIRAELEGVCNLATVS